MTEDNEAYKASLTRLVASDEAVEMVARELWLSLAISKAAAEDIARRVLSAIQAAVMEGV